MTIDDPQHLSLIAESVEPGAHPVRVCLDVDASLRIGPLHLGVRRSPVHTVEQAVSAARTIAREPAVRLVGLMFYDAQLAGVPDRSPAVRAMKARSAKELARRRPRIVEAVRALAPIELVNGGGTGSLHLVADDDCLTEVAAGSGLFGPTLFDGYRDFTPRARARLRAARHPAARPRCPHPVRRGIRRLGPGRIVARAHPVPPGRPARSSARRASARCRRPSRARRRPGSAVGDRVWWRHAKAGEICERFATLHLVDAGPQATVTPVPTYRGEGQCFG